jgi:hypothetical protein
MSRRFVNDGTGTKIIEFTDAEKSEIDAAEKEWADGAATRAAMSAILALEAEITPRRIREAILGTDSDWLKNKEAEIATERSKL